VLATDYSTPDILNLVLGVGVVLGGIGYAVGQFFSARRKGVSDSLATALNEISALNSRAERLEKLAASQASEMANLKSENALLRNLVTGGQPVIDEVDKRAAELKEFARKEHEKTRAAIAAIRKDTQP
jgi:archaellum component FlaC